MKIGLVSPAWDVMVNSYPPLGLGYLAASLRREGHEVKIFDFGLRPGMEPDQEADEVVGFKPDLVGITVWTHLYYHSLELAREIKCRNLNIPIVLGGPHITVYPLTAFEDGLIDYTIYGEGEETIVELVQSLEGKIAREEIRGLCYRNSGSAVKNDPRPFITDLDSLPLPARDLLEVKKYPLRSNEGEPMTTILTSRGCPYSCIYCFKGLFGKKYREKSALQVVNEIEQVRQQEGIQNFYFVDDLFVFNRNRLHQIISLLKEREIKIKWQCLARVDKLKKEDYPLMAEAGCYGIHFGIETGNEEIMKQIGKHITLDQVRKAVGWAREAGIRTKGYFMIGLPGDTKATIRQTLEFAIDIDLDEAMFSLTTPLPGTELWEMARKKEGGLSEREAFSQAFYFTAGQADLKPLSNLSGGLSDEELVRFAQQAPGIFWKRCLRKREFRERFGYYLGSLVYGVSLLSRLRAKGRY
ncbi:MAG: radical SAM protein [bacterium]